MGNRIKRLKCMLGWHKWGTLENITDHSGTRFRGAKFPVYLKKCDYCDKERIFTPIMYVK